MISNLVDRSIGRSPGFAPFRILSTNVAARRNMSEKAVDKIGSAADGKAVVAAMKSIPTDDPLFGKGTIRQDGRKLHPMYLLQVKSPDESKGDWDYMKIVATIPADKAFRPLEEGGCPLVKK